MLDKDRIMRVIDLFSKGFTLDKAIESISPIPYSTPEFLTLIEEKGLGEYWISRRKIRETVVGTLEEVSNEMFDGQVNMATPISIAGEDQSKTYLEQSINQEINILKSSAEVFWKMAVIQQDYLKSALEIEEVITKSGMNPDEYYYYLSLHKTLREAHENAINIKEQIYLPRLKDQKMVLMKQVMSQLIDQTKLDNYNIIETTIENSSKEFYDALGS